MTAHKSPFSFRTLAILLLVVSLSDGFFLASHPSALPVPTTALPTTANQLSRKSTEAPLLSSTALSATGVSSTGDDDDDDAIIIIDRDFRLAGIFLAGGILLDQLPILKFTLGPIITLLGLLFLVQTFRLKFVCDSSAFALQNTSQKSGENIIVGGENRWKYTSFVNYAFFPEGWIDQPQGPILVYFKETQTPSSKWNEGPGKSANSEEAVAKGAKPGQVHFFPALCNCQQLKAEWERRGCNKL